MSGCCGSSCPELDKPPSRANMGIVQIIELIIMGIAGILCFIDLYYMIHDYVNFWNLLEIIVDVLIIAGLVFIIIGLFFSASSQKIRIGIICFFAGTVVNIVCIVYFLIYYSGTLESWLISLIKVCILIFLAYVLWRQSKNI